MLHENSSRPFNRPDAPTQIDALKGVGKSVYTLFRAPLHEKLHYEMTEATKDNVQPIQPPIPAVIQSMYADVLPSVDKDKIRSLAPNELTMLAGVLVQFTDYVPELQPYAATPYDIVEKVYDGIVNQAAENSYPLSFPEQLDIVLKQNEGDLPESLWNLFFTSRFLGRWLDGHSIPDLPSLNHNEIIDKMVAWQKSLLASKSSENGVQDVVGDTYYTWTHALSQVVFEALPENTNIITHQASNIFKNGTQLMHTLVHSVNPQAVVNRHDNASEYGNAIGEVCVDKLEVSKPTG